MKTDGFTIESHQALQQASLQPSFMTYIREISLGDTIGYAVCTEDGVQLAVFGTQEAAYFSARQFNLTPVSVH